jgi:hypothetical protein
LSYNFPIQSGLKQRVALSPQLFNFDLEYVITTFQEYQVALKLNGIHQRLAHADDVNPMGDNIDTKDAHTNKQNKLSGSVRKQPTKLVLTFAGRGHCMVSATDTYDH